MFLLYQRFATCTCKRDIAWVHGLALNIEVQLDTSIHALVIVIHFVMSLICCSVVAAWFAPSKHRHTAWYYTHWKVSYSSLWILGKSALSYNECEKSLYEIYDRAVRVHTIETCPCCLNGLNSYVYVRVTSITLRWVIVARRFLTGKRSQAIYGRLWQHTQHVER